MGKSVCINICVKIFLWYRATHKNFLQNMDSTVAIVTVFGEQDRDQIKAIEEKAWSMELTKKSTAFAANSCL